MLYSTYVGGSYNDTVTGVAVDSLGNSYITGYTSSTDFPITAGAVQPANAGTNNAFLAKLSPDGGRLLYSTYLGGSGSDGAFALALDSAGNAYLTGFSDSTDFPFSSGAFQTRMQQNCAANSTSPPPPTTGDAFVAKIATDGAGLRYSTLLGGGCADEGWGIAVDSAGSAYVAGATTSRDFPVTSGALQPKSGGESMSGFLAKLNPQGSGLVYSTYLGGPGADASLAVTVDGKGSAYVTGSTSGFDQVMFNPGPFLTFAGSATAATPGFPPVSSAAAYVLKLDPSGSSRQYLKYLGGVAGAGTGIALDSAGDAWLAGGTYAILPGIPFPTVHPFQAKTGAGFVSELSPDGSTLLFSSLLDSAQQLALDRSGNAFVIGASSDVPGTSTDVISGPPNRPVLLVRVDAAVPSALTLEEPQRIVPSMMPWDDVLASGSIIVLTCTGLGPAQEVGPQLTGGRLATTLAGTSITIDGVEAPLLSVQSGRVVCLVPFADPNFTGFPIVQAHVNGADSNSIKLAGGLTSIEVLAAVNADGSANSASRPAAPGSIVTLYAAGLGPTNPPSIDGQINDTTMRSLVADPIGVKIGDQDAEILFIGPAPGQVAGITQINFRVPQLTAGTYPAYLGYGEGPFGDDPFSQDFHSIPLTIGQPAPALK